MCADIKEKNKRLRELQAALKVSATLFEPEMKGEETPETRDVISEEDLVAYAARLAAETGKEGGGFGGFGGKGGDKAPKGTKPGDKAGGAHAAKAHSNKGPKQGGDAGAVPAAPMSDLEKMEAELLRRRNQCEMEKLTGEVADMVDAFDEALSKLRREKLALEADLKQAEIKRLVMYQELQLLKDFEKRENALNDKLTAKKAEKKEVVEKIRHCQESLDQKKSEIDKLIEHKKAVAVEFDELVDDQHNFREPLLKIFMRKIKRSKKAQVLPLPRLALPAPSLRPSGGASSHAPPRSLTRLPPCVVARVTATMRTTTATRRTTRTTRTRISMTTTRTRRCARRAATRCCTRRCATSARSGSTKRT